MLIPSFPYPNEDLANILFYNQAIMLSHKILSLGKGEGHFYVDDKHDI